MSNPFDQNFFKFLFGFTFILFASFTILFLVTKYGSEIDNQAANVLNSKFIQ